MADKRNRPCPCGSNKRYKKCCGLIGQNHGVEIDPASAIQHCNKGVTQRAHGLIKEAESSFRLAIKAKPDLAEAHYNLGVVLEDKGFWDKAEISYREALIHKPGYINALNRLGSLKKAQGKLEEAASYYLKALTAMPESDMSHFNLARTRLEQGRLDDAREIYRKVLLIKPDYGEAHRSLSSLIKYQTKTDSHLQEMENLFRRNKLDDSQRMHLAFALGKAYEDLAEYEKSFNYYQEGNRLKRATFNYSTDDTIALFEQIKQVFTHSVTSASTIDDIKTPIFIVGMPRSGTTLVEQILASHPEVFGGGELMDFLDSILQITNSEQLQEAFNRLLEDQGQMFLKIGEAYLRRLSRYGGGAHLITDKLPSNFMFIGLIRQALPFAKIIHCRRDSMDTCFSIYKNFFVGEINYAYELTELGEYYQLYEDLMQFWHRLFPDDIYDLSYEKLIVDQEKETRRLLDYCGLPWHQACLTFHQTNRPVATASATQVRRPIYNDSIELWRNYEKYLTPLKAALVRLYN